MNNEIISNLMNVVRGYDSPSTMYGADDGNSRGSNRSEACPCGEHVLEAERVEKPHTCVSHSTDFFRRAFPSYVAKTPEISDDVNSRNY